MTTGVSILGMTKHKIDVQSVVHVLGAPSCLYGRFLDTPLD